MNLRTRLALLVAGAVAVAVVVVIGVTYRAAADQQREALDESLQAQAQATAARAARVVDVTARFPQRADPFAADDLLYQVVGSAGLVRHPIDQSELPVSEADLAVARGEQQQVLDDVTVDGEPYRLITVPLRPVTARRSGAVQLARSLEPVESSLAELRRTLLAVAGLGVGVAALLGIAVARQALRPVRALTETAEHVAATQQLRAHIVVERRDELGRLAEAFNAMLAALATSREQQQRLVTDASHELRTPLTSLRTNVELLQRAEALPADERRQVVDDAVREVEELSALVAELVDLATDARRATEEQSSLRLDEIVERAAERARRHHGREVTQALEPTVVRGSAGLLERAVDNLLDNAGKWSPPDGQVRAELAGGRLRVLDDGPGVAETDLPRLWDRFWRAEGSQAVPGSGLGLAIVREIAEAHGGTVHAANRAEGGLDIGFTLPVLPRTEPETAGRLRSLARMRRSDPLLVALLGAAGVLACASPAAAHGAGTLSELPVPRWQFAWFVAAAVVIAFFAVGATWRRPRLESAAAGRPMPAWTAPVATGVGVVLRVLGLVVYVVIVTAGLFGSEFPAANIAPIGVLITFWVGIAFLSVLVGDVWRVLSPFETVALVAAWLRARLRREALAPVAEGDSASHWPAVVGVAAFVWLELAYHSPTTPRVLGRLALAYGIVVLAAAARWGRGWLRTGEGFGVLFGLFAALAPYTRDGGGLRYRWPLAGAGRVRVRAGTLPLLLVVLGAAVFDGVTRTTFWFDLTVERLGWGFTAVNTAGLAWTIGIVALAYLTTTRVVARLVDRDPDATAGHFAPLLIPVAAAFTVAHYFSLLVLEGQGFWILASDPYGEGWNLFGTADGTLDINLVSLTTIAWVQAGAIALGHVGAVLVAHDRAIGEYPPRQALAAQYVLLAFILGAAVAAVALLLGT